MSWRRVSGGAMSRRAMTVGCAWGAGMSIGFMSAGSGWGVVATLRPATRGRQPQVIDRPGPGTNRGPTGRTGRAPWRAWATMRAMTPHASAPATDATLWDRYRPVRRSFEWGFWIVSYLVGAIASSVTV